MDAERQISVIADELRSAAETIIGAASESLQRIEDAQVGDARHRAAFTLDSLKPALCAILEACAFQDQAGQRLARLSVTLQGRAASLDPLLNGPRQPGEGLDQEAADRLFNAEARPR